MVKSRVIRSDESLIERIRTYQVQVAQKEGRAISFSEAQREFAQNAFTPYDDIRKLAKWKVRM